MVVLFVQVSFAQADLVTGFRPDPEECYIIARGTRSKQAFISERFNIINDSITHIGIGITTDSGFRIFNVNPVRAGNALFVEDLDTYFGQPDLVYAGIWQLMPGNGDKMLFMDSLRKGIDAKVSFDNGFMIDSNINTLYCSEYCWRMTNLLGPDFWFDPREIDTVPLGLDGILGRESLLYIPVDYFLSLEGLRYCGSWSDKNFKF